MENKVLPQPALPQISVGRPWGNPPLVISSKPAIPVRDFGKELRDTAGVFEDFKLIQGLNFSKMYGKKVICKSF
jgi:hypothetical protein